MPYRIDLRTTKADTLNRLIDLGALDVEALTGSGVAALMPDRVSPGDLARALGVDDVRISTAVGRDADSVWILRPRPIQVGAATLHLVDAEAFGTGQHPTTSLCLDALQDALAARPERVLDVGTGSGVLATAALLQGVPHATGIDTDDAALRVAAANARLNGVHDRLQLTHTGPEALTGTWPLVLANVLAAPLIEMAPTLVRRVGHRGRLVLSGIPASVAGDVDRAYCRLGMVPLRPITREGWTAVVMHATW